MAERPELCWYCRRARAVLWCDYMLGAMLEGPEQLPLQADLLTWPTIANRPAMTPDDWAQLHHDLLNSRMPIATCDAAACVACAQRHGWRRVGHICARPISKSSTIDHCHAHAGAGNLGETAWVGGPAIELLRRDVRVACVRASMHLVGGTGG